MAAQPEVVVAVEANHEQLVERHASERPSAPQAGLHSVILPPRFRKPICRERSLDAPVPAERSLKERPQFSGRARIEREPSLGKSNERALNSRSECNRRSIREKGGGLRGYRE